MKQAARLAIFLSLCHALFAQAQAQAKPNNQIPASTTEPRNQARDANSARVFITDSSLTWLVED